MPGWWIVSFGISLIAAFVVAAMPELVLVSLVYTFGILLPFWLLAANFWWVLALVGLWLFVHSLRGSGWAWSVVLLFIGLVAGLFYSTMALQRTRLPAQESFVVSQPLTPAAQSVDYVIEGQTFSEFEVCDALCLGLMRTGALRWLRLVRFEVVDAARVDFVTPGLPCSDNGRLELGGKTCFVPATIARRTVIIERRSLSDCRAKVPDHPADAPCLLFAHDDGRVADVQFTKSEADNKELEGQQQSLVKLRSVSRLKLEDMRGIAPVTLAHYVTRSWEYKPLPVPLFPAISLTESGGGLNIRMASAHDVPINAVDVLGAAGLLIKRVEMLGNGFVIPPVYESRLEPEVRTLAITRGAEPQAIWSRVGPTKRKIFIPRGLTKEEMEAANAVRKANMAKRRAKESELFNEAIRQLVK